MTTELFDTIIIGGGPAGLSAAVALGRARRSVAVIDDGRPRNAPADGIHNFLGSDGISPFELAAKGRAEAEHYGATVIAGTAASAARDGEHFLVTIDGLPSMTGRRLIVTTGLTDLLPEIPGLAERWGRDAIHCPYCHGWEVRGRHIGILASGPMAMHQALLFRQWSEQITYFANGSEAPSGEQREMLDALGIAVIEGPVTEVLADGDALSGLRIGDEVHPVEAIAVGAPVAANSALLSGLGLESVQHPSGAGSHIPSEMGGVTTVPGVYVAGNVADPRAQVVTSAGDGLMTGAMVNADLTAEEQQLALAAHRAGR